MLIVSSRIWWVWTLKASRSEADKAQVDLVWTVQCISPDDKAISSQRSCVLFQVEKCEAKSRQEKKPMLYVKGLTPSFSHGPGWQSLEPTALKPTKGIPGQEPATVDLEFVMLSGGAPGSVTSLSLPAQNIAN